VLFLTLTKWFLKKLNKKQLFWDWNSWDCFGPTVTEDEVKTNADCLAVHLNKCGWEYIVVDIRCYVENDKAHGYSQKDAIKFSLETSSVYLTMQRRKQVDVLISTGSEQMQGY
jgi:hypothetical protein